MIIIGKGQRKKQKSKKENLQVNKEKLKNNPRLRRFYDMLYPEELEDDEYIRLVGLRKDKEMPPIIKFVRSFDEFVAFIARHRCTRDVYCQIATNRGKESGIDENQYRRKVLFLDFDFKDYPDFKDAKDVTAFVRGKIPKLFIHACINSGHGVHLYVSIDNEKASFDEIVNTNIELAKLLETDLQATKTTQLSRPPETYNHKCDDGSYDYKNIENWKKVISVFNGYEDIAYHPLGIPYINMLIKDYHEAIHNLKIMEKIEWDYAAQEESHCYFCIQKILKEGADVHERNTWLGRIVKYLQQQGIGRSEIHSICQEWNSRCRPPKAKSVIEADVENFMKKDYQLLGCYDSIPDERVSKIVEKQCDQYYCKTRQNGISIQTNSPVVEIPISLLSHQNLTEKDISRYAFLLISVIYMYRNDSITVKQLKEKIGLQTAEPCMNKRTFTNTLKELLSLGWIELSPHKEKSHFDKCEIRLSKKATDSRKRYIIVYCSIVQAVISGKISKTDYLVYLIMLRNLNNNQNVTHEKLADDLHMDKSNVGKSIRNLVNNNCLLREAHYHRNLRYFKYSFPCPDAVEKMKTENIHTEIHAEIECFELNISCPMQMESAYAL